jgi:rod shape-determining protein MreC
MIRRYFRTKLFKVLVIVSVCGLLIFFNPREIFSPFRSGLSIIAYPFQKILYFFSLKIKDGKELVSSIGELKKENERLEEENRVLLFQIVELEDLKNENDQLRKQLEFLPRSNYELQSASIIGQSATGTNSWVLIDIGENRGIKKGMAVIISKGNLVGKIDDVSELSAKVNLITNPDTIINVETSQQSARGIIHGEFGLGVMLDMVVSNEQIEAEDKIFTSGIGGDIPRGFFVGTIKEMFISGDGLFKRASIIPAVDFSKLKFVFVVKGTQQDQ